MPSPFLRAPRRPGLLVTVAVGAGCLVAPAPAPPAQGSPPYRPRQDHARGQDVVRALERGAHPLRSTAPYGGLKDLRPLGRIVGDAGVVGLGEATHGSHEFFALKHRVFRYLVEKKGFTTFMQELGWGTGLRLNDYVLRGEGNPRQIMLEEFRHAYTLFRVKEYLRLIEWMRAYNKTHRRKLQFMGNDVYYPHDRIFQEIFDYARERHRPDLIPRLTRLYDGLIPGKDVGAWLVRYHRKSRAERLRMVRRATEARRLVRSLRPGAGRKAAGWAEQQARVVLWTAKAHAAEDFSNYRDEGMAFNTVWWHRHKKSKILLSAHDAHVGATGLDPEHTAKRQGVWMRELLGRRYLPIGLTFYRGSFNAFDSSVPDEPLTKFTIGPPPRGNTERVLDRVPYRDYMLDMRTVREPARSWLDTVRPIRNIGSSFPEVNDHFALRRTYQVLIHLHRVTAARIIGEKVVTAPRARSRERDELPATR
ncbi:hypothetical protein GCM10023085_04290 [Actinomadura viridis]|uniref:Erythromycin esterase n=1 Tax=Actinomadura viridis TaxID=58110 RepID=A0A931GLA1_9ACTN|nr:erythromycin esterase family protein [Actinomadura viridis]MBG6091247.1 erythromycin esterase [Actinomadura viridis]